MRFATRTRRKTKTRDEAPRTPNFFVPQINSDHAASRSSKTTAEAAAAAAAAKQCHGGTVEGNSGVAAVIYFEPMDRQLRS